MAVTTQTMTDEQRKSVALEYLKAFDNGGSRRPAASILELFATDAQVYFPKWGIANGREEIGEMFGEVGGTSCRSATTTRTSTGSSPAATRSSPRAPAYGEHKDGPWRAGVPEWGAGRWCDVFEIRDFRIQRCFIYLDPDYAGKDADRYPWIAEREAAAPA